VSCLRRVISEDKLICKSDGTYRDRLGDLQWNRSLSHVCDCGAPTSPAARGLVKRRVSRKGKVELTLSCKRPNGRRENEGREKEGGCGLMRSVGGEMFCGKELELEIGRLFRNVEPGSLVT